VKGQEPLRIEDFDAPEDLRRRRRSRLRRLRPPKTRRLRPPDGNPRKGLKTTWRKASRLKTRRMDKEDGSVDQQESEESQTSQHESEEDEDQGGRGGLPVVKRRRWT